ncbi:MAG: hypothetical protein E7476_07765 [Ruminococcaceae bacterium]|nr:hypothetical protein [Oscillospiraceae bacterium]
MPREKEAYRDNLERIDSAFPGKELLTKKDVSEFTGANYKTVNRLFPFKDNYISKATLARCLS